MNKIHERQCEVQNCDRLDVKGVKYCKMHYQRFWKGKSLVTWREKFIKENPPKDGIGLIPLTRRKVAIVNENIYHELMKCKWCAIKGGGNTFYAYNKKLGDMHRHILNPKTNFYTDHINRNGLDNRRCNLREATATLNGANRAKRKDSKWKFKGIRAARNEKWQAVIKKSGNPYYLGTFDSQEKAAKAYNYAAKELFGEFAVLNDVGG